MVQLTLILKEVRKFFYVVWSGILGVRFNVMCDVLESHWKLGGNWAWHTTTNVGCLVNTPDNDCTEFLCCWL